MVPVQQQRHRTTLAKIKLLHLADIHLGTETYGRLDPNTGLRSRVADFAACLDEAVDRALQEPVDVVIFAGDAYRNQEPNQTLQREFARRIHRLSEAGVAVFLLVGNHDLPNSPGRANVVDIFETLSVPNVYVGRSVAVYRIETKNGPLQVVAVPWRTPSQLFTLQEYKNKTLAEVNERLETWVGDKIDALAQELDPAVPAVLVAHLSVHGATAGTESTHVLGYQLNLVKSKVANPAFDYVALGHIHKHQVINAHPPVVYAGSIERVDFSEEKDTKGFVLAEVEKGACSWEFVPIEKARKFITIRVTAYGEDPLSKVLREISRHYIEGAIVRVIIETDGANEPLVNVQEVYKALKDAYHARVSLEVQREHRTRFGAEIKENMTPAEALEKYLQLKDCAPDRAKVLMEYAQRVINPEPLTGQQLPLQPAVADAAESPE